jgi:homoserine dehydrogenase
MTVTQFASSDVERVQPAGTPVIVRVGLLGLGQIGAAVARLAASRSPSRRAGVEVTAALVRDPLRPRPTQGVTATTDAETVFRTRPTVIVEALGGLEPARTLVLDAIARGIPVVTANKSLLAHHGDELAEAAARAGVSLRFEASVVAGVPFLGTFARRPYASALTSITGIVNGTTNFILSQMQDGTSDYSSALADAQRRGFAEPEPSNDVDGIDAAEKLVILMRQFGGPAMAPGRIETTGITTITPVDLALARALGGTLKPVVHADGLDARGAAVAAFAGPAFVPASHPLARVNQVTNGLCLRDVAGTELCFTGPGAGPDATAVTILDDVLEAAAGAPAWRPASAPPGLAVAPVTAWFVRLTSTAPLRHGAEVDDSLGAHGVWTERTSGADSRDGLESRAVLTYPCARPQVERAAAALAATGCATRLFRALEPLA